MSAKPSAALAAILAKLAETAAALEDAKRKPAPADGKSLAALKALVGGPIHPDLAAFHAWSGNADRVLNVPEGTEWLGIAGAVSDLKMLHRIRPDDFPKQLVPVSQDGAGNYGCVDNGTGAVFDWDHETGETSKLAPSLEAYLKKAALKPLEQAVADRQNTTALKGKAVVAGAAVARPSKIVRVPRKDLAKLDRAGYAGGAKAAVLLRGGRVLLGFNFSAEVWDMGAQKEAWHGMNGASWVTAHHRASSRLLISRDESVGVFDVAGVKWLARWDASGTSFRSKINCLAFTSDGKIGLSGGGDGRICLWDVDGMRGLPSRVPEDKHGAVLEAGKPTAVIQAYDADQGQIGWLRVSPDDRFVASSTWGGDEVHVWDLGKRKLAWHKKADDRCATFAPDGTFVVRGEPGAIICLGVGGRETRRLKVGGKNDYLTGLAFAGAELLIVAMSSGIKLFEFASGKQVAGVAFNAENLGTIDVDGDTVLTTRPLTLFQMK